MWSSFNSEPRSACSRWWRHALLIVAVFCSGCSTFNGARPLDAGQHQVGLTLGGPTVMLGDAPLPIPSAVVEGRHGITEVADRPLDVNYGLNITGLPFGILQIHGGGSWLALTQRGGIPAVAVTSRLFFANNLMAMSNKAPEAEAVFWLAHQFEVTASWLLGQQLIYTGVANYLDYGNPSLTLTPLLGAQLDPGEEGGLAVQLETRWYAVNQQPRLDAIKWFPQSVGSLGMSLGVSYVF